MLDDTDRRILRQMQADPAASVATVAQRAGLSHAPCWRRIARMERDGVIKGRQILIDQRKLGLEVQVFLRITLDKTARNAFDAFIAEARTIPEVTAIQTLLGRVDIRMDVTARDLAHYQQIYRDRIMALPHILDLESLMLVSELKNTQAVPV
ncbi:Lrp/AsnC family transcriptional regulator [Pontivivens nitratireducens]|uniref:Lrp/AsnC family transcriptional regulator n=1 Tax=Pontivivens nitratireducens TaxID=2758038 RepID=A0A6G7VN19_9RHOB|nr:Lrp/AsnC family transcriptional regulator [Pontibrevibacter nitratireducens]QIK41310.1 Lrp/AsnC family transcriptional regulator [Pontibrevibacter nitratireducens]